MKCRLLGNLCCGMNEKILKFECFTTQEMRIFEHIKNGLRTKLEGFESVGIKFVSCFIAVQNYKRFARV